MSAAAFNLDMLFAVRKRYTAVLFAEINVLNVLKLDVVPCHAPLPPPSWGTTFQLKTPNLLNNYEENKEVYCHFYLLQSSEEFQLKTDLVV